MIYILLHSGTFVTINKPTLTSHHQPKSVVYIRAYSLGWMFCRFWQMQNGTHPPLLYQTEYFALKVCCALSILLPFAKFFEKINKSLLLWAFIVHIIFILWPTALLFIPLIFLKLPWERSPWSMTWTIQWLCSCQFFLLSTPPLQHHLPSLSKPETTGPYLTLTSFLLPLASSVSRISIAWISPKRNTACLTLLLASFISPRDLCNNLLTTLRPTQALWWHENNFHQYHSLLASPWLEHFHSISFQQNSL